MEAGELEAAARRAVMALLAGRSGTVCPSEAARVVGGAAWREAMPAVHAAVDALVAAGHVRLSWKGEAMTVRAGPYRIGLVGA